MTVPLLREQRAGFRWLWPVAVCALVLGLFGWMAKSARIYGRPNPAEHNYNLLVRGFQSGQLSLKRAVPPGLAQLSDPLDPAGNAAYRAPSAGMLDLSYFRGRLYLYFGVTPALLLFWPWAALTGHYLSHQAATAVFCGAAFMAGAALLLGIWRRYFPEVGPWVAAAGVLAFGLVTGLPVILQRAEFYEVAVSCACALTLLALGGVWLALEEPARRSLWLAAASLSYGLAVGARPSVLFGAVILLVPVALSWRERAGVPWTTLAAAVIPLTLCGLGLMLYNDLRFGRPFEFGHNFQMAGERVAATRYFSPSYLWFNIRVYFLEPARWTRHFPFVHEIASPPLPPGHAKVESGGGILTNLPVWWMALAAPLAWRPEGGPARVRLRALGLSTALLFGAGASVFCLFFSNTWRYEVEFLPALAIVGVLGIFGLERALAGRPARRIAARACWSLLLAFSLAYSLLECVNGHAEQINKSALLLVGAGQVPEAVAEYEHALRLRPDFPEARSNLGNALAGLPGRLDDAVVQLQAALRLDPDLAEAHNNLGNVLLQIPGRLDDAIAQFKTALRLRPDYAEAHNNLGSAWYKMPGRLPDAIAEYREVLRLQPNSAEAHNNLGTALNLQGRTSAAIAEYEAALRLKPDDTEAHNNLGNALWQVPGRFDDAIAQYEAALRLQPDLAALHFNLAVALLGHPGRAREAAAQLETVLRLQPDNETARKLLAGIRPAPP